ncbi:hypothetical protein [Terasakiella sp.]|uniref:hypothetical protein n=1 Tax=Terasakiella sp. TaxID=2034861 RepID=UPI003AA86912
MAIKVPTSPEAGVGQVRATPLNTPDQRMNTNADMFGANKGRDMVNAGRQLQDASNRLDAIAMEQKELLEKSQLLEAEKHLEDYENAILHDPEKGAYAKKGKSAFGLSNSIGNDYDKFSQSITKGFTSQRQRLNIERLIEARRSRMLGNLQNHERRELNSYYDGQLKARIQGSVDSAANNYTDPKRVQAERHKIITSVEDLAQRNGMSEEEKTSLLKGSVSAMHSKVVERMLAHKDDQGAQAYLEQATKDGELLSGDANRLEKLLKAENTLKKVQSIADNALVRFADNEGDALAWVEKNLSGDEEKQAKAEIKNRFATRRRLDKEALEDRQKRAREQMANGIPFRELPQDMKAAIMADGSAFSAAMTYEANVARMGTPHAKTDDSDTETKLNAMQDTDLVKEDLSKHKHALTETTFQNFVGKQKKAKERLSKMQTNAQPYNRGKVLLKDMAPASMKFGSAKAKDVEKALANRAVEAMNLFIDSYIDQGKEPTDAELRKEAARLMMQVEADPDNTGNLGLPKKGEESFSGYSFQTEFMSQKQIDEAFVPFDKISDTDKKTITDALKAKGWAEGDINNDVIEMIAGAYATRNLKRMIKLLEKAK